MDSSDALSKPAHANRRTEKQRGGHSRRATKSSTKTTTTTMEGRMDGSANNFSGHFQGSPGQIENQQIVYNMQSPMHGADQAMQLTASKQMFTGSPHFQSPVPHMNMPFLQAILQHPGQFHGQFPGSPNFVSSSYGPVNDQGNHESTQEAMAGDGRLDEDEVEEVPATQVPQAATKKKGACHRGPGYEIEEDCVLVSGWLNISKDAATGTNQDKESFYKRLRQYFLDNCSTANKRSLNSIQQRWSTIQTRVSRFCAILRQIERINQSGKSYQDMVNEAIKIFQQKEPWHYGHCWEMLKDEPKWNDKVLEILQNSKGKKEEASPHDASTPSSQEVSSMPDRPEGRDAAKRRRASRFGDTSSSSVAVDMLQKMHVRGQEMDEVEMKHKEELMSLERAKFELQQKQWQAKFEMMVESNRLNRELTHEQIKVQREAIDAQLKVKLQAIEVERMKNDTQIMFTDTSKLAPGLREWVMKRQMDIMIRDGVQPSAGDSDSNDTRG